MLATIVYAINPKQKLPVEGFTSYAETEELALRRRDELEKHIASNGWKHWSGSDRRAFMEKAIRNNWEVKTKLCLIDY